MYRSQVTLGILATLTAVLAAQPPPPPPRPVATAPATSVSGRVLDAATDTPLINVRVGSPSNAVGTSSVLTDDAGRFTLSAPARSLLRVSKTGYGAQTISAVASVADVRLQRSSAIAGRVFDDNGDPVIGVRVSVEPFPIPDRPGLFLQDTSTDDRGEFRLGGFAAGTYTVSVLVMAEPTMVAIPRADGGSAYISQPSTSRLFYPGVSDYRAAKGISLAAGEENTTVDFIVTASQAVSQQFSAVSTSGIYPRATQEPEGRGVVRGQVVAPDGRPLARAQVRLMNGPAVRPQFVWADNFGQFEFAKIPAGHVQLIASKAGFFPSNMSAVNPAASFDLADGEAHDRAVIQLIPWSVIEGRVVDEQGEPMANAAVQALQVQYTAGRRALSAVGFTRTTNDRGEYRLYGLMPGQYIVSASIGQVSTGDVPGYARSYYPGTTDTAAAQYVTVTQGQNVSAIDVALARVKTARVAGRMIDSHGMPTTGGRVELVPSRASVLAVSVGARISPDGHFEFPNVPAGSYVIQVAKGMQNAWTEGEFAAVPVTVAGTDVADLLVQTTVGTRVTGRVIFNGAPSAVPEPGGVEIRPVPSNPDLGPGNQVATARLMNDWTFELNGVNGPRRLQVVRTPKGWALDAVRVGGVDVTDRPLAFGGAASTLDGVEIELTDRFATLQATAVDGSSRPSAAGLVIVFSADPDDWYPDSRFVRASSATTTQPATFEGLPPGSYYVAALDSYPPTQGGAWQDPSFLASLTARASAITVRPASTTTVRVRVMPGR